MNNIPNLITGITMLMLVTSCTNGHKTAKFPTTVADSGTSSIYLVNTLEDY